MNKLEKDGKVAVMISPGFGAGWSTWNSEFRDTLLFDAEIARATGCPTQSVSAHLRDLRKPRYGSHPVERRRVSAGVFQYRVCA